MPHPSQALYKLVCNTQDCTEYEHGVFVYETTREDDVKLCPKCKEPRVESDARPTSNQAAEKGSERSALAFTKMPRPHRPRHPTMPFL